MGPTLAATRLGRLAHRAPRSRLWTRIREGGARAGTCGTLDHGPRSSAPASGEVLGPPLGCRDRYLVDATDAIGHLAVVEHLLAAAVHRRPDAPATAGGRAQPGPRGPGLARHPRARSTSPRWATWSLKPRDETRTPLQRRAHHPARLLELISPGGLRTAFRTIDTSAEEVDIEDVVAATASRSTSPPPSRSSSSTASPSADRLRERPKPRIADPGPVHTCARGELNPHVLSDTRT